MLHQLFTTKPDLDDSDPVQSRMAERWPEFLAWLERAREDHAFPEVEASIERIMQRMETESARRFALHLIRSTWHAARWHADAKAWPDDKRDMYANQSLALEWLHLHSESAAVELDLLAANMEQGGEFTKAYAGVVSPVELKRVAARIREAKIAIKDVLPASTWQVGPLLYQRSVVGRTQTPNAAALLALDALLLFRAMQLKADWALVSSLTAIAGIEARDGDDRIDRDSLRMSAANILKDIESGSASFIGWPLDIGGTTVDVTSQIEYLGAARKD